MFSPSVIRSMGGSSAVHRIFPFELLFSRQSSAILELIIETGRRVQAAVKQDLILYLRANLHTLGQM